MNTLWLSNVEILAQEERADFRRELEQIRLERRTRDFSKWMVSTGERLHRRYSDTVPVPRWYQSFKVAR